MAFTLDRYGHVLPGMQPEAAEMFDELVFGPPDAHDDDRPEDQEETDDRHL